MSPEPTDCAGLTQLLAGCAAGDHDAFSRLYDASIARVFGMVLRVLRDHAQAEEVTQEIYLTVWRDAGRFDPARGSALSWLLTIAHRKAVDRVRSSQADRRRDADEHRLAASLRETAAGPDLAADGFAVRAALGQLTRIQREALELAYFGGHTHVEIGAMLQIPLGTGKSRIRDGLLKLRDLLTPIAPEIA